MAPKPKEDDTKIVCSSPAQLTEHINEMHVLFSQPESEHNWEKFAKSLAKLAALTRGGAYKLDNFVASIGPSVAGGVGEKIVQCMLTERAGLSKYALELLTSLAPRLASRFTGSLPRLFVPPLLELIRRTNNIIRERAENCLFKILETCHLVLLISYLVGAVGDSAVKLRKAVGVGMKVAVEKWEAGGKAEDVERVVKALVGDKDVEVRKVAKELWELYRETWPDRVDGFTAPLTPTIRKRLDIKGTQSAAAGSSSALARPTRAKAPSKPKPMEIHPAGTSTAPMGPPLLTTVSRPRLEGLGSGPPARPAPFHGSESFASSSRHPMGPPSHPPPHMSRSATYSHPQLPSSSSSSSGTGHPPSSSSSFHRTASAGHPPPGHASSSSASYTFPHPVQQPQPPPSHSYSHFQTVSRAPLSRAGSVADLAASSAVSRSGASHPPASRPGHGRTPSASSSSASASAFAPPVVSSFGLEISARPKRQGGPMGLPMRGGEGGGVPYNPISRKHVTRGGPVASSPEAPTTPTSSPAKAMSEGSPQIGDILQKSTGADGLLLEEKPLPKKIPTPPSASASAPVEAAFEPVAVPTTEEEPRPLLPPPSMKRSISFMDEPLEADLPAPLVPVVREEVTSPVDTLVDPGSPLLVFDEPSKADEAVQPVVEVVTPAATAEPVQGAQTAQKQTPLVTAADLISVGDEAPVGQPASVEDASVAQVDEEPAQATPSTEPTPGAVAEVAPPPTQPIAVAAKPAVAPASKSAAPSSKPRVPTAAASSKLVRAPSKVFKPVSRPLPAASAAAPTSSKVAPPPAAPTAPAARSKAAVAPSRPATAAAAPATKATIAAPLAKSISSTSLSAPAVSTSKLPSSAASKAAEPAAPVRRPLMKMKAGGPPPKVEAEPRKERIKTKAPLPSFKPVSRAASAAVGGPGMGTIKKTDAVAGPGTKANIGATSTTTAATSGSRIVSGFKAPLTKMAAVTKKVQQAAIETAASIALPSSPVLEASSIALPPSPPRLTPTPATSSATPTPSQTAIPFPTTAAEPTDVSLARLILNKANRDSARFTPRSKTTSITSSDIGDAITVYSDSGEERDETEDDEDEAKGVKFNAEIARKMRESRAAGGGGAEKGVKGMVSAVGTPVKREFGGVRDQNVEVV